MIKGDYEKYIGHYVPGAKKISVRSKTLQLNLKEIDLKVKKSFGNYDLFFNKVGKLMHSVHYENEHSSKVLYAYDENDLLLSELQLQSITNILISDKIYTYDEHDRIKSITAAAAYQVPILICLRFCLAILLKSSEWIVSLTTSCSPI